jgi:hypothetical protein
MRRPFRLKGWVEFEYEDIGVVRMEVGSPVYQPDRIRHRQLTCGNDLEILETDALLVPTATPSGTNDRRRT